MIAFKPEAQTLLTVVHTVDSSRPAPRAHCLAGFCPTLMAEVSTRPGMRDLERSQWEAHFAERTFPKKTSWTSAGLIPSALSMAAEKKKKKSMCQSVLYRSHWLRIIVPLIAWAPSCVAERLERELSRGRVRPIAWKTARLGKFSPQERAHRSAGGRDNVDWRTRRHDGLGCRIGVLRGQRG